MLFFSPRLSAFDKGITTLFQLATDEDDTQGERQGEEGKTKGVKKESDKTDTGTVNNGDKSDYNSETSIGKDKSTITDSEKTYWILSLIKTYADFTNNTFDIIWDKSIVEFFNMIAFIKEYKRREADEIKRLQKKASKSST